MGKEASWHGIEPRGRCAERRASGERAESERRTPPAFSVCGGGGRSGRVRGGSGGRALCGRISLCPSAPVRARVWCRAGAVPRLPPPCSPLRTATALSPAHSPPCKRDSGAQGLCARVCSRVPSPSRPQPRRARVGEAEGQGRGRAGEKRGAASCGRMRGQMRGECRVSKMPEAHGQELRAFFPRRHTERKDHRKSLPSPHGRVACGRICRVACGRIRGRLCGGSWGAVRLGSLGCWGSLGRVL